MNGSNRFSLSRDDAVRIWKGFLIAAAGSIATFATMISTPLRPVGPRGHRRLLRCFYLSFFRHKRSSDEV